MTALREIKTLQFAKFGDLREQLHCAALSIAANLAEGVGKDGADQNVSSASRAAARTSAPRSSKALTR